MEKGQGCVESGSWPRGWRLPKRGCPKGARQPCAESAHRSPRPDGTGMAILLSNALSLLCALPGGTGRTCQFAGGGLTPLGEGRGEQPSRCPQGGGVSHTYILNRCFSKKKKRSIQEHVPVPLPCYNFFSVSHLDLVRCRGLLQRVHQRMDGERDPCTPDLDTRGLPKNDGRCVPLQDAGSPWHTDPRLLLIPA
jgi:hypothetical protein